MKKTISVCILLSLFMTGCFNHKLNVVLNEDIKIEYGYNAQEVEFINTKESDENIKVKEIKGLDTKKIGEQKISLLLSDGKSEIEKNVDVIIEDTKKPTITLKKAKLTVMQGDKLDLSKDIKYVKDEVDGNLKYSTKKIDKDGYYIDKGKLDTNKKGTYKVDVIAIDKNGNETKKAFDVVVKKHDIATTNPLANQSTSTSPSSSKVNHHSSNKTNQQNQLPAGCKYVGKDTYTCMIHTPDYVPEKNHVHHFDNSGYTDGQFVGPVFDNVYDCGAWMDDYDNPEWSGWGSTACQCSCGKWRGFCFNIDYAK